VDLFLCTASRQNEKKKEKHGEHSSRGKKLLDVRLKKKAINRSLYTT
jgi:hypothetical protein